MHWESSKLRQYLLGNISEKEKSEFDLQLLSNQELITAIEVAEEELIDDYLDEILTANELERFKQFFLNAPQRIKQIEFSQQLKNHAKQSIGELLTDHQKQTRVSSHLNQSKNK